MKDSIFIPIAACNERFIEQTVRSALHNAKHPEKVFFGIFNNITNTTKSLLSNDYITKNSQVFYTELVSVCAMGVGFGRLNASLLQFTKFDYMFQIDAHMLFPKNWDESLIDVFNLIKTENNIDENKIVLSSASSLKWFNSTEDLYKIMGSGNDDNFIEIDPYNLEEHFLNDIQGGAIKVKMFYDGKQGSALLKENIGFPIVYGERPIKKGLDYEETNGVHASFMFSKANLNRDVLHDPEDFFHGDQTNYSVRLLSRGYRIFSPKYPVISCMDKGRYDDKEYDWRFNEESDRTNAQIYLSYKKSGDREFLNDIISGRYFGYWGAPDQESLDLAKEKIEYTELGG
jgi:hypothetical protein